MEREHARRRTDDEQPREARRPEPPAAADAILALQRSAGNAAVGRMLARRSERVLARDPEIEPTDPEMGQHVVGELLKMNGPTTPTTGVHYAENYQQLAQTDPQAKQIWKEDYWKGYANPAYWDRTADMAWQLKPAVSAAAAIKDWLAGLTIAECATALVAIELDTMRAAVGDKRFDEMFSSRTEQPEHELLRIHKNHKLSSAGQFMTGTAEKLVTGPEQVGHRTVTKGEWYYFYNHPKYLLKHPGGSFQGENCICMDDTAGQQKYSGFGVASVTEPEMLEVMARAYNEDRTERDYQLLVEAFAPEKAQAKQPNQTWKSLYDDTSWWRIPKENRVWFGFPDKVTGTDILKEPELKIGEVTRKGGFVPGVGKKLDANKVAAARNPPVLQK